MNEKLFDFENTFPPIGHPEHHFNKYPNHPWLKSKDEIDGWIKKNILTNSKSVEYNIEDDLTVIFNNKDMLYIRGGNSLIPIQINYAAELNASNIGLKSLIGSPYEATALICTDNKIQSLEGLGNKVEAVFLENNRLKNFKGMKEVEGIYLDNNPIESWDGFVHADFVHWWQEKWCKETSFNLLIEAPESIKFIIVNSDFHSNEIIKENEKKISMNWLRNQQKKIKDIKEVNSNISNTLNINCNKNNRRKI